MTLYSLTFWKPLACVRVCGAEPLPSGDNPLCSPLPGSASSESTPDDFVCWLKPFPPFTDFTLTSCTESTLPFGVIARSDRAIGSIYCSPLSVVPFFSVYLVSLDDLFSFFHFASLNYSLCRLPIGGLFLSPVGPFWAANECSRIVNCVCVSAQAGIQMATDWMYWLLWSLNLLAHLLLVIIFTHKYVTFFRGTVVVVCTRSQRTGHIETHKVGK